MTAKALETPMAAYVGPAGADDSNPAGGASLRPGEWKLPPVITDAMVTECRDYLRQHERETGPVQNGRLRQWLGIVCSGVPRRPADTLDEKARLDAMLFAFEETPTFVFNSDTCREAQRRFKFVPSVAELCELVDEITRRETERAARAFKVSDHGPGHPVAAVWDDAAVEAQRQRNAEKLRAEHAAMIAAGQIPPAPPPPTRKAGETDRDYGLRIAAAIRGQVEEGERALRQAERAAVAAGGSRATKAVNEARTVLTGKRPVARKEGQPADEPAMEAAAEPAPPPDPVPAEQGAGF